MAARTTSKQQQQPNHPAYLGDEGLTLKKTAFIIVTVIGCIAILWPKVFYPIMFGATTVKPATKEYPKGSGGLRQERPAHLHPESIYQAMRERGRAIPAAPSLPIMEGGKASSPSKPPPRIVEGRPGPIPGMRPPMGAGAINQPQHKGSSMGILMPIYTIGIIVFFCYTLMKILFKKPVPNAPYGQTPTDPNFRKEVFGQTNCSHVEELSGSTLGLHPDMRNQLYNASLSATTAASNLSSTLKQHQLHHLQQQQQSAAAMGKRNMFNKETDQLMEIEKLRKKLEDTEKEMAKLIAEMNSDQYEAKINSYEYTTSNYADIGNGHTATKTTETDDDYDDTKIDSDSQTHFIDESLGNEVLQQQHEVTRRENKKQHQQRKRRDESLERSVAVLGMEVTASCEGGQKWSGRPPTPVFFSHNEHSKNDDDIMPEPKSIYLEGALMHDSQILISDSETTTEKVYDAELNGSPEEPAVVLSSKMTLSLINMDSAEQQSDDDDADVDAEKNKSELESPLADDIEIIGHDEK